MIVLDMKNASLLALNPKTNETLAIPRINLEADVTKCGLKWTRRQFPVQTAFAITNNKAQGQTMTGRVGVYLKNNVFHMVNYMLLLQE